MLLGSQLQTYGLPVVNGWTQHHYDARAFATRIPFGYRGCPTRPELFRRLAESFVPGWFEWHDWTNRVVDALCHRRYVGLSGCSGSAKTRNVSGFAATWWLAAPEDSSVIFCSTTMKSLRKRGWAEIQRFFFDTCRRAERDVGNFVDSRTVWQSNPGDDLHAIFGMAVGEGDINKVAANIQGIHTKRQMVVIDEAEAVPAAIWKACSNLYSYPVDAGGEFVLAPLANPRSRLSQYGRWIEPEGGWDSVSVDTDEWESKPQLDGKKALIIRFDFLKSPNVLEGKTVSKHLPTKARVKSRMDALKAKGAENDPDHYAYDRGFPPPEGLSKTVFTESLLIKFGAYDKHEFTGNNFRIIGAYDQARTGDRPALRFFALGEIKRGMMGMESLPAIVFFPDAESKDPIAYQYLFKLRKHCANVEYRGQKYSCDPGDLGIDVSNEATFGDLCQREWSPNIIRVQFGAAASDDPASPEDMRPANEVYRNKRAEMYFRAKTATESGQLKGIDKETAEELCQMEYSDLRADGTTKLITLMEKKEYKLKFTKSPDLADSEVIGQEVARLKGFRVVATGFTVNRDAHFAALVQESQKIHEEVDYHADNDGFGEEQEVEELV